MESALSKATGYGAGGGPKRDGSYRDGSGTEEARSTGSTNHLGSSLLRLAEQGDYLGQQKLHRALDAIATLGVALLGGLGDARYDNLQPSQGEGFPLLYGIDGS